MSREKLKELAVGVWGILFGFVGGWFVYQHFVKFESGELPSMKLWAPLAMIYNLGGHWTIVSKWVTLGVLFIFGLFGIWMMYEALKRTPATGDTLDGPGGQRATALYVHVTSAQLAARAEVDVDGPRGPLKVKIPANFPQNSSVRLPNQGHREGQDLLVRFIRKTLP